MTTQTTSPAVDGRAPGVQRAVRAAAVLVLLNELYMFLTAGRLFPHGGPEEAHSAGALTLHVFAGLAVVAVFLLRRRRGGPLWPLVLAAVVFVDTFVQAATGGRDHLAVHIPGAMLLTLASAWLAAWAFQDQDGARRA